MITRKLVLTALISLHVFIVVAQQKKPAATRVVANGKDSLVIPVSKADLGTFPYFTTLRNFYATDSMTIEHNLVYFFDGKKYFTVEGKVSHQNLNIKNSDQPIASEFECIQEFDKVIATLGGVKVFTGKLPEESLKNLTSEDMVTVSSKSQLAPSAFYGIVEYVIKTPEKEVWVQLQPYSLGSKFYTLLIVEKTTPLLTINTNKPNTILDDLQKNRKAIFNLYFEPDNANLLTESKDEILSLIGIFQAHPDWHLKLECHNAPVGKPEYILALTDKRANAVKQELVKLGAKSTFIDATGNGDKNPIVSNDTEKGRLTNTRFEITLQ